MKINPDIFRAYDIRGLYPDDLNEEVAYLIGRAYVQFLRKKKPKIVVGQDNRLSSPQIFNALTKGMTDQGADVINIGLSSSPLLYFAVANYGFDGGINVTASHNPPKYNGFKIVKEKSLPVSGEKGIYEIRDLVLKNKFQDQEKGKITTKEVFPDYKKANLKGFDLSKIKPMKIVIDTANAVPGLEVPEFLKETKCQIDYLFLELDGSFPNHEPDPLKKENITTICQKIKKEGADLGVAFDGDGDRILFIDEKGEAIEGDLIIALISKIILKDSPGENIVYDVRSSNIVPETIKESGGNPMVGKIGHTLFKEKMRKENAIFGGELSGHYYHRDHFFCESPFFVLFKILEKISQDSRPFSEIVSPFRKYFNSGEINFKVKDKERILKELEKNPPGGGEKGKVLKLDGLRIDFKDWWFLVRPSNTEPLLRLVIEGKSKELVEEKTHLLSDVLNG